VEKERKKGITSPVLYFITVVLTVNIDYPSYKDIL